MSSPRGEFHPGARKCMQTIPYSNIATHSNGYTKRQVEQREYRKIIFTHQEQLETF